MNKIFIPEFLPVKLGKRDKEFWLDYSQSENSFVVWENKPNGFKSIEPYSFIELAEFISENRLRYIDLGMDHFSRNALVQKKDLIEFIRSEKPIFLQAYAIEAKKLVTFEENQIFLDEERVPVNKFPCSTYVLNPLLNIEEYTEFITENSPHQVKVVEKEKKWGWKEYFLVGSLCVAGAATGYLVGKNYDKEIA